MLHELTQFVMRHWELVAAFVIVLILLILEERKGFGKRGEQVTPVMAVQLINREDAVVLDVRDAAAFRAGHIVNAKNFPQVDFEAQHGKWMNFQKQRVIVVDAMGLKTAAVIAKLKASGFEKAVSLKGGMDAWKAAGYPVVSA